MRVWRYAMLLATVLGTARSDVASAQPSPPRLANSDVLILSAPDTGALTVLATLRSSSRVADWFIAGYRSGELRVISTSSGHTGSRRYLHIGPVLSVSVADGGGSLLSTSEDGAVRLWSAYDARVSRRFIGHRDAVWGALSNDGKRMVTASRDRSVRLWKVESGREYGRLSEGEREWTAVAMSPSGDLIAAGSADGRLVLWSRLTWRVLATRDLGARVRSIAFTPDGLGLVSGGDNRRVTLHDVQSLGVRWEARLPRQVHSVTVSPDGEWVAAAGEFDAVPVWRRDTGRAVARPMRMRRGARGVAFAPDDSTLLAAAPSGRVMAATVRRWDVPRLAAGVQRGPLGLHISHCGDSIWVYRDTRIGAGYAIVQRDTVQGQAATPRALPLVALPRGGSALLGRNGDTIWTNPYALVADVSPNGGHLLAFPLPRDSSYWVLDTRVGRGLLRKRFDEPIDSVKFLTAEDVLVVLRSGRELLLDRATGEALRSARFDQRAIESPPSTLLAPSDAARRGKVLHAEPLPYGRPISLVAQRTPRWWGRVSAETIASWTYSVGQRYVFGGTTNGEVRVWNANSGAELARVRGHSGTVTAVAVSGDGRFLFSAAADGTLRRWRLTP